jgi:hypothetical protein
MQRYSFSYGTRLHGNIAAMLAGARAMWIVHDMRLREVCEHFRLPTIGFEQVRAGVDLQDLYDRADYSQCHRVYPERYRALFDYVEGAGLPHVLPTPADSTDVQVTRVADDPDVGIDVTGGGGVRGALVPQVAVGH